MADTANWHKSSYTGTESCVEVADNDPGVIRVRDSKRPHGPVIMLTPQAWAGLVALAREEGP
ncbi:DUF397 domain-containing protein [Streptomyces sp. NPDC058953]|uniref:DUF397 domain-containing protein n=1 Tax=unclassified Streptomyces TaxID=2593676 RepID=UPI0036C98285